MSLEGRDAMRIALACLGLLALASAAMAGDGFALVAGGKARCQAILGWGARAVQAEGIEASDQVWFDDVAFCQVEE